MNHVRNRVIFLLLLFVGGVSQATIPRDPDFTFRWNRFTSVTAVDTFVVAAGRDGLMVFQRSGSDLTLSEKSPLFMNSIPISQHRFGSILLVQTSANVICFFDLTALPNLSQLGQIDLGVSFNDVALRGNDLYVSRGFDGLFRYRLTNYNNARLLDSNLLGIHCTQLQIAGDSLLALDDYNGVLFYQFADTGFAKFQDYLYLPFQVSSFLKQDSLLVLATNQSQAYVARLRPGGISLTDTFNLLIFPNRILASGSTMLLFDSSAFLVVAIDPLSGRQGLAQLALLPDSSLQGQVSRVGSKSFVLFPLRDGGLGYYDVDSLWAYQARPLPGLIQQGQVTALQIVNGKLFIGAAKSPVDEFGFGPDGAPVYERTLYSALNNVTGIDASGDSIFVSYPQIRRSIVLQVEPDSNIYRSAFYLDTMLYQSLRFNDQKIDTLRSAFTLGESQIGMYTITDSGSVEAAGHFNVVGRILDIQVVDSVAAVSTGKGIWLFRIFNDFTTEYRSTVALEASAFDLMRFGHDLALFTGSTMLRLNITDPFNVQIDTLMQLPFGIMRATQVGRLIYAVGLEGICVIDASGPKPVLLDSGGRGGYLVAAGNGLVAVSDSNRVHIYNLSQYPTPVNNDRPPLPTGFSLDQNYPNPFNPTTTISYTLPARSKVELAIYNVLGQRVRTLVDQIQPAGSYRVEWNGRGESGNPVATGIYFYLLRADRNSESKKMILLK